MSVLVQLLPITVTHSSKGFLTAVFAGTVSSCCCPPTHCCCPGNAGSWSRAGLLDRFAQVGMLEEGSALSPLTITHRIQPLLCLPRASSQLCPFIPHTSGTVEWMEGASGEWWVALNPPLGVLTLHPGQHWIVHPRKVSAFVRRAGSVAALLPWAGLPWCHMLNTSSSHSLFLPFLVFGLRNSP